MALSTLLGHTSVGALKLAGRRSARLAGVAAFVSNPIARIVLGTLAAYGFRKFMEHRQAKKAAAMPQGSSELSPEAIQNSVEVVSRPEAPAY